MTISSQVRTAGPFTGNGVAIGGPFAFKIFNATEMLVVETSDVGVDRNLVYGTDFSITLNADQNAAPGGTINYLIAGVPSLIPLNYSLNATSNVANLQPIALTNGGGFFPKVLNDGFDRVTILVQQLVRGVNSSLKFPLSDGTLLTTTLPNKTLRALKAIVFDAQGNVTVSTDNFNNSAAAAAASAAAALASQNAASGSATSAGNSSTSAGNSAIAAAASAAAINYRQAGTATGTANALILTPGAALASYTGALVDFTVASANTTEPVSVNVSGLGVKNIKQNFIGTKVDPAIGLLQPGMNILVAYDGTDFVITHAPWDAQASDIAAAATVALASTTGNFANLTGTGGPVTAITGLPKGKRFLIRHTGIHTLTNSATLSLAGNADITVAAGDISAWVTDGTNVYMTHLTRFAGTVSINGGQVGGFRNRVINGALRFWQRNTSFTFGAAVMVADNFFSMRSASAAGGTTSQQTDVPTNQGFKYSAKIQRTAADTAVNTLEFNGLFESDNISDWGSQTVAISFWAKKGANYSAAGSLLNVNLRTGTGLDQAGSTYASWTGAASIANSVTLTTVWQKFTVLAAVGASVTEALLNFSMTPVGTAGVDDSFYVTGIQTEIGQVSTPFERRPYAVELNLCQYHYEKSFAQGTTPAQNVAGNQLSYTQCVAASTVMFSHYTKFDAEKRIAPAITIFNPAAANAQVRNGNTGTDCSGTALGTVATHGFGMHTTTPAASAAGNGLNFQYTAEAANL